MRNGYSYSCTIIANGMCGLWCMVYGEAQQVATHKPIPYQKAVYISNDLWFNLQLTFSYSKSCSFIPTDHYSRLIMTYGQYFFAIALFPRRKHIRSWKSVMNFQLHHSNSNTADWPKRKSIKLVKINSQMATVVASKQLIEWLLF